MAHLTTVATVFREPRLRRLELSWGGYYLGEWAHFVALSIYAFEHGGATAVGVLGFVRMGAAAVALPFGSLLTDRYPRQRVLVASYAGRAALLALTAVALAAGSPRAVVFALAALAAVAAAAVRPATMALVPVLARTPEELVAANVSASSLEGAGTLLGPLVGGILTARWSPGAAVAVAAAVYLGCAAQALRIRHEGQVAVRLGVGLGGLSRGVRTLLHDPHPRLVVLLFAVQTLVRGLLNVLLTVAALDVLHLGAGGVGWLNGALGAGGLLGGALSIRVVGRRRLAAVFALGLVLWGTPIAAIGAAPAAAVAFTAVAVVGLGNALLDVSGFTLLQRTVDEHVLGRVFGVFEILVALAVAAGSALGALAVAAIGIRAALVAAGLVLPALALLCAARLMRIDEASEVPERRLALLAALPLLAPLPVTVLERLAQRLRRVDAPAGTTIVEEGAPGDSFYVIGNGEVEVLGAGVAVRRLTAGDSFGEIALLRDLPRSATCRAVTDVELFELDRETFVASVTGDLRTTAAADAVIDERLGGARAATV